MDVVDHKPVGLHLVFALLESLAPGLLGIRLGVCVATAASAWALHRVARVSSGSTAGWIAALLFTFHALGSRGLEANAEVFFTPWVVAAFLVAVFEPMAASQPPGLGRCAAAGLLLGIALQVKYVVVFECVGVAMLVAWLTSRGAARAEWPRRLGPRLLVLAGMAIVPTVPIVMYFAATGHWAEFVRYSIEANVIHRADTAFNSARLAGSLSRQVLESPLLWMASLSAPLVAWRGSASLRRPVAAGLLWAACAALGIAFTRSFFRHYYLQLVPAQCLLAAVTLAWLVEGMAATRRWATLLLCLVQPVMALARAPLAASAGVVASWIREGSPPSDTPQEIADWIRPRLAPGERIYVADYPIVIHYLLGSPPLTRFVFPEFLTIAHFSRVAGVDPVAELDAILARSPRYVIRRRSDSGPFYERLEQRLHEHYALERSFEESDPREWQESEAPEEDRYIEVYRLVGDERVGVR